MIKQVLSCAGHFWLFDRHIETLLDLSSMSSTFHIHSFGEDLVWANNKQKTLPFNKEVGHDRGTKLMVWNILVSGHLLTTYDSLLVPYVYCFRNQTLRIPLYAAFKTAFKTALTNCIDHRMHGNDFVIKNLLIFCAQKYLDRRKGNAFPLIHNFCGYNKCMRRRIAMLFTKWNNKQNAFYEMKYISNMLCSPLSKAKL